MTAYGWSAWQITPFSVALRSDLLNYQLNEITHYTGKKTITSLIYIRNAPIEKTINTEIEAPSKDVVIHKPMSPVEIVLPNMPKDIKWPEVEMVSLSFDFAFGGGLGGSGQGAIGLEFGGMLIFSNAKLMDDLSIP